MSEEVVDDLDKHSAQSSRNAECEGGTLAAAVAELRAEVVRQHEHVTVRERVIDRLLTQNDELRVGERRSLLRPILTDLQRLRHELIREAARSPDEVTGQGVAELLLSYARSLQLTLERGGVAVLPAEPGDAFDPTRHRATGTVPAATPDEDATLGEVVLDGYLDVETDRVVTAAAVRVRRWSPPDPAIP